MTQQEHLLLIRAKCVELLELAKRRTPGRWHVAKGGLGNKERMDTVYAANDDLNYIAACRDFACFHSPPRNSENAAFIASAAGPFEAALASTVAAIDAVLDVAWIEHSEERDLSWTGNKAFEAAKLITASWPLELLQQ